MSPSGPAASQSRQCRDSPRPRAAPARRQPACRARARFIRHTKTGAVMAALIKFIQATEDAKKKTAEGPSSAGFEQWADKVKNAETLST